VDTQAVWQRQPHVKDGPQFVAVPSPDHSAQSLQNLKASGGRNIPLLVDSVVRTSAWLQAATVMKRMREMEKMAAACSPIASLPVGSGARC